MSRSIPALALLCALLGVHVTRAQEDPGECAKIRGTARYGALGYDHIVVVDNQCTKTVACEVWTDVDPQPHHPLTVAPGEQGSVKTRVGSPAREFSAQGKCEFP